MDPDRNAPDARAILAAYRTIRVPPDIRAGAWDRLQRAIDDDEDVAPAPVARARRPHAAWGVALLVAAAVVLVLAGLRRTADPAHVVDPADQAVHATAGAPEPAHARHADPQPDPAPSAAPRPAPAPTTQPPERRPTPPRERPDESSTLEAELSLLRAARAALGAADPTTALRLLADHARRFPGGHLTEERMILRAQALCERGDHDQAREAHRQFNKAYPNSPHAGTLAETCRAP